MKHQLVGLLATILVMIGLVESVAAGTVTVSITEIRAAEGRLFVGLFRPQDDFPRPERAYKGLTLNAERPAASTTFVDVPDGTYAVAVFHDVNRNGQHDRNLFGVPREDYGFSNDARGSFGPPAFKSAAFVHQGRSQISITLHP